jgi:hypothetical protein
MMSPDWACGAADGRRVVRDGRLAAKKTQSRSKNTESDFNH